jgi:hypothetical protein
MSRGRLSYTKSWDTIDFHFQNQKNAASTDFHDPARNQLLIPFSCVKTSRKRAEVAVKHFSKVRETSKMINDISASLEQLLCNCAVIPEPEPY